MPLPVLVDRSEGLKLDQTALKPGVVFGPEERAFQARRGDLEGVFGPWDEVFYVEDRAEILRELRANAKILVAIGACAINGGLPAMRNRLDVGDVLNQVYRDADGVGSHVPNDPELPLLFDKVYPVKEVVRVDYFIPGCPPSADAIWKYLNDLILGRMPRLDHDLLHYD